MVNIVGHPASEMFAKFEDLDPRRTLGGGDVKYHVGATGVWHGRECTPGNLHLVLNPSHLEAERIGDSSEANCRFAASV